MPYVCCVIGCSSRWEKDDGLTFHKIPTVIEGRGTKEKETTSHRRAAWLGKINRKNWLPSENTRICSRHFIGKDSNYCNSRVFRGI